MPETTERVWLRRTRDDDLDQVVEWLSDGSPAAALTSDVRENVTHESIRAALSAGLELRLVCGRDGTSHGIVTWRTRGHRRSFELAVLIGDEGLWRTGIGGEATVRAVDHLFMTLDAERVGVLTGTFNPYATPALVRGGFTLEGVMRHFYYLDGIYHDALVWSMLRSEHRECLAVHEGTPLAYRPLVSPDDIRRAAAIRKQVLSEPDLRRSWSPSDVPAGDELT